MISTSTPAISSSTIDNPDLSKITVKVIYGQEVLTQIENFSFLREWDHLCDRCPWSTVFQTSAFVSSWYEHYAAKHTPIMVIARHEGQLVGLLTLADDIPELGVAGAGGYEAYYHTWISTEPYSDHFICTALTILRRQLGNKDVCFKYLPPNVPINWFTWEAFKNNHVIRPFSRPIITLSKVDEKEVIGRKTFKEKINRLKRNGDIRYETLRDASSFEAIIDELADHYDFRKVATLNISPFKDDPQKKGFLIDLVRRGVLEVDVLSVKGDICAALTMTRNYKGWSHGAGVNTHSPYYNRLSPGYVILKMAAVRLSKEDTDLYDVTPGGHQYKEVHADAHDTILEVRFTNKPKAFYLTCLFELKELIKTTLAKKGIDARLLNSQIRGKTSSFMEQLSTTGYTKQTMHKSPDIKARPIYSARKITPPLPGSQQLPVKVNSLRDILFYSPSKSDLSNQAFMKKAVFMIDSGFTPYTFAQDEHLDFLIWLAPQQPKVKDEALLKAMTNLPENAVLFYAPYYSRRVKNKINQLLESAALHPSINLAKQAVYIIE